MFTLIKKGLNVLGRDGIPSFFRRVYEYLITRKNIQLRNESIKFTEHGAPVFKDILFINGCGIDYPRRYRVLHQIEQLHFNGFSCDEVWYENVDLNAIKYYRGFVFYRCPFTETIGQFISEAKRSNKKVLFDIDDLVIDEKYTRDIKFLSTMSKEEYSLYLDGVNRMQKTLSMCDGAITTTERLANELKNYTKTVFINKNVASEEMVKLSQEAIKLKKEDNKVVIGYLSGSITHNDDFIKILPIIKKILLEFSYVELLIVGMLDIPKELHEFSNKIKTDPFQDWKNLPRIISNIDINLVLLEDNVFNEAKSENKWTEASLVKTVSIMDAVGPYKKIVQHGINGLLCETLEDWYNNLSILIKDQQYRKTLAEKAYLDAMSDYTTHNTGYSLSRFLNEFLNVNIGFILPSLQNSGGINVILKHAKILFNHSYDVVLLVPDAEVDFVMVDNQKLFVINATGTNFHVLFHKMVATFWATVDFLKIYPKVIKKFYLVQGFETNFYEYCDNNRIFANLTYNLFEQVEYITISKWCKDFMENKFFKTCGYVPNGIDINRFRFAERDFSGKIKILIEGNPEVSYKNTDESFKIVEKLDKNKFEIWYLHYDGDKKTWYRVDRDLKSIPFETVNEIYRECHILLKSSIIESFSYPPLEMMATGGVVVVSANDGNAEYVKHFENCLLYNTGDIETAVNYIHLILSDIELRNKLISNGLKTANAYRWESLERDIVALYER